jgi:cysteinyl-tRNA synthetase
MPLRMHNSLTRRVEDFVPRDPRRVTFYSCGPTVYDDAHIGNFRSFLNADLLRRWLESPLGRSDLRADGGEDGAGIAGSSASARSADLPARSADVPGVIHIMNITDVGHMTDDEVADGSGADKMEIAAARLAEAKKAGKLPAGVDVDPRDPYAIAEFYTQRFLEDARKLGMKVAIEAKERPELMPRATGNVPQMIETIQRLIDRGSAYVVGEPGARVVYFDVRSFEGYGRLSGNTLEQIRAGAGGRVSAADQAGKRHPADFMLWKEDAGHLMKWDSPWGAGYPGWHIECSAMSWGALGRERAGAHGFVADAEPIIDIHSGGEDNIFPHHECEIAQSACAFNETPAGAPFARLWFHTRFLLVEGEKMAKSKGNFFTARDLLAQGHEPAAVRLELIRTHYRANANFTMQGLKDSARMIERWRRVAGVAPPSRGAGSGRDAGAGQTARDVAERDFIACMNDDLNIAGAIGAINTWLNHIEAPAAEDAALMAEFDEVLGVLSLERRRTVSRPDPVQLRITPLEPTVTVSPTEILYVGVTPDPGVEERVIARFDARAKKDFATADAIRDELLQMGYTIKDVAGGKVEVSRG